MQFIVGDRTFDLTNRALVMGILNRTPDSFSEKGKYFDLDRLLARAEEMVAEGADILDIGGVKAGPGPAVGLEEELDRVVPAVEAVCSRFDVVVSVDTWNAVVLAACIEAGARIGNDISGFQDPDYLSVAGSHGAAVVATHIRLGPRIADPDPHYSDLVGEVEGRLSALKENAIAAGVKQESVVVDAGLDLGKNPAQSMTLLHASSRLAGLGCPLLLSASYKTFLGETLSLEVADRKWASLSACAIGIHLGARILRVHDVGPTRKVRDTMEALGPLGRDNKPDGGHIPVGR